MTPWIITLLFFGLLWSVFFTTVMPGHSFIEQSPELTFAQQDMKQNLQKHIDIIAEKIGERNMNHYKALQRTEKYIEEEFTRYHFSVSKQSFNVMGKQVNNIVAERRGTSFPKDIVVIGAHYDSAMGSPGANDNASGVAVMLEIARHLATKQFERSVRFIAFVNEEPPYSFTSDMGSTTAAKHSSELKENIVAMFSLETLGFYTNRANSQRYPKPLDWFYPDSGNFVAFVSNINSRPLLRQSIKTFRQHATIASEGLAAPTIISAINLSDHWSYWQQGYQAIMITDTAMFRYPFYHSSKDTKDKIDYESLTRVTTGIIEVIISLAGKQQEFL